MEIVSVLGDGHFEHLAFVGEQCVAEDNGPAGLERLLFRFLCDRYHTEVLQLYKAIEGQAKEMVTVSWTASDRGVVNLSLRTSWYDRKFGSPFVFHESNGLPEPVS